MTFARDKGGSISTRELGYTMRAMGMNPTEGEILDLLNEVSNIIIRGLLSKQQFLV